jgi:CheY-like chemotaxis protein/two-component sensor histidine kinase
MPVLGFSEILLTRSDYLSDPDRVKQYLELINTSARDAMHIVSRLREFYRSKDKVEDLHEIDLNKLVEQAIGMTRPKWKDEAMGRGVVIQAQTQLDQVPQFIGNENALREALTNLIFNAVDAMPGGGVLSFRSRQDGGQIVLEISDTGGGMTEEVARRCFEPFFSTKGKGGTGLGLSMVYGIVRRHDGTIDVKSKVGQGTTFMIRLPVKNTTLEKRLKADVVKRTLTRKLKILVVDDEPLVRETMAMLLRALGHAVVEAADGPGALDILRARRVDLVFTDLGMPGMSGWALATAIKTDHPTVPVILLTGWEEPASGDGAKSVDAILRKPIRLPELKQAVDAVRSIGQREP